MILILSGDESLQRSEQWIKNYPSSLSCDMCYEELASLAERLRFPKEKYLFITNLNCLNGESCIKKVTYPFVDYAALVIPFDKITQECELQAGNHTLSSELVNEALTHLVCTLRDSHKQVCLLCSKIPQNIYQMVNVHVKCDNGLATVLKSNIENIYEGYKWTF